MSEDLHWYP